MLTSSRNVGWRSGTAVRGAGERGFSSAENAGLERREHPKQRSLSFRFEAWDLDMGLIREGRADGPAPRGLGFLVRVGVDGVVHDHGGWEF